MLAQEDENGIECGIHYLNWFLNDAKTRYSPVEKLCLCLYFSYCKLKYYMKSHDVLVLSKNNIIKFVLSKPITHNRIGKWSLAMTEISLIFEPLKSIKGQVIDDFMVDHMFMEIKEIYVGIKSWILYFDGSQTNESLGVGILIVSPNNVPTKLLFEIKPVCSNNEAKYEALITGLETLMNLGIRNVIVRGDLKLVINHVIRKYKCISSNLMKYFTSN